MENFNSQRIAISEKFYRDNDRLLEGGIWAEVTLAHNDIDEDDYAFSIEDLRPIQLSRFDFKRYAEGRAEFTRDEWIAAVLRSVGLEPAKLRDKLVDHQAGHECVLTNECPVDKLRQSLVREEALLREKDELLQQQEIVNKEADHRFLNGLQLIVSLLSLQSRGATNPDVASALAAAAKRVAMIESIHRRLHDADSADTVALKKYIGELCHNFSAMLAAKDRPEQTIDFEGIEIELPTVTAIPLGFIVSELITNAAKHGNGHITVSLGSQPEKGYSLSVTNNGPVLPDEFDPDASKGLGMKIVRSYMKRIDGELRFGPGDRNQGARFTVLF